LSKTNSFFLIPGVVIGEEVGMRMKVSQWISSWMCREVGVEMETSDASNSNIDNGTVLYPFCEAIHTMKLLIRLFFYKGCIQNFKLVLAEPLANAPHSHVRKFITEHDGPGLQHIGLATEDAEETVQDMLDRGAAFRKPPPTYYKLVWFMLLH
jgi:hypothetical protein